MFGLNVITMFLGLVVTVVLISMMVNGPTVVKRKCLVCEYEGQMKTWLGNYTAPLLILLLGFLFLFIPGLIFMVLYWGKYKCPECGSVGKNKTIAPQSIALPPQEIDTIDCPFCAETIKSKAHICRYCRNELPSKA